MLIRNKYYLMVIYIWVCILFVEVTGKISIPAFIEIMSIISRNLNNILFDLSLYLYLVNINKKYKHTPSLAKKCWTRYAHLCFKYILITTINSKHLYILIKT